MQLSLSILSLSKAIYSKKDDDFPFQELSRLLTMKNLEDSYNDYYKEQTGEDNPLAE